MFSDFQGQKKLRVSLKAEQETLYGSKPSPSKMQSIKKAPRMSIASNRKLSLGGTMLVQTPTIDRHDFLKATPHARPVRKSDQVYLNGRLNPPLDNFIGPFPVGKGGNDITGPFIKSNSFHEPESPMVRKPFSPLSSTTSVKADRPINSLDEAKFAQVEGVQKILPSSTTLTTPDKAIPAVYEENRTSKVVPIPIPGTPLTVSVPCICLSRQIRSLSLLLS